MFLEVILGIFALLILSFIFVNRRHKGCPPSPAFAIPILGHLPYFAKYEEIGIHFLFSEWAEKYGPIISVQLGMNRAIVLRDAKLIKEAWSQPELCGRFHLPVNLIRSGTDGVQRGVIFQDGEKWTEQRRFLLRHLRDFGFGKTSMESIIMDEAQELIRGISQKAGKPISTQSLFNAAIINAIWTIVAGERFRHDDPKLIKLVACVTQNLSETGTAGIIIFMAWLAKLFPNATGWSKYVDSFYETNNFIRKFVESRKETHDENTILDFTACYIDAVNKTADPSSGFYKEEGIKNLVTLLDDLFSAGGETTSTTLTWLMLCLAMHPDVQEKLHSEIDGVIGKQRLPSLADKISMPYTEAVFLETMRVSSVVATGVFHYSMDDFNLKGWLIPKGTMLIPNFHGIHHDPKTWGDPENFRPERFLGPDGKTVLKHDSLMPFSIGKRICPGETLAKDELFLITTTIVQKFKICPDPLGPKLTMKQKVNGIVAATMPHQIVFNER